MFHLQTILGTQWILCPSFKMRDTRVRTTAGIFRSNSPAPYVCLAGFGSGDLPALVCTYHDGKLGQQVGDVVHASSESES